METTSLTLGPIGEELAFQYLGRKGYKILLRNYQSPVGEIDIIAKDKGALVFVEVKTRRSDAMGTPAESVTREKRHRIVKNAKFYMKRYGIHNVPCRFDVVSILMPGGQEPIIELIQNAFLEGE